MSSDSSSTKLTLHKDFRQLFFRKEGKALMGHRYRNAWVLIVILFVTFCAIGFANGSLEYLGRKMDDPFINWINISVPFGKMDSIATIKGRLNEEAVRSEFRYKNVTGNFRFTLRFPQVDKEGTYSVVGRTLELGNPLLEKILAEDNRLHGTGFSGEQDAGLIVTQAFLQEFGYEEDASHIPTAFPTTTDEDIMIPLPIVAIVDELPGLSSFATTPFFYSQRFGASAQNPFHPRHTTDFLFFVEGDEATAGQFQQVMESWFMETHADEFSPFDPFPSPVNSYTLSHQAGYLVGISLTPKPDEKKLRAVFGRMQEDAAFRQFDFLRCFSTQFNLFTKEDEYDNLNINFENLDRIREFREYCKQEFDLEIDMAQVEARENFNFVSKLTYTISLILIGFSVLSICLFLSAVFRRHLDKIRRNIGTFKAFGLDNRTLISTYLNMITGFLAASILGSLLVSWIFGSLGGIRLLLWIFRSELERGQQYFDLLNWWTLVAVLAIMGISFVVLYSLASRILSRTPGDLLYDRE
ncbi:MAG: ABC transporter permease [Bacteroidota bacterium]